MFSLLYTFCLHLYLINIHIFDYPDSRLSGLFTEVPTSLHNRGSIVQYFFPKGRVQTMSQFFLELCSFRWDRIKLLLVLLLLLLLLLCAVDKRMDAKIIIIIIIINFIINFVTVLVDTRNDFFFCIFLEKPSLCESRIFALNVLQRGFLGSLPPFLKHAC